MRAFIEKDFCAQTYRICVGTYGGKYNSYLKGTIEWVDVLNEPGSKITEGLGLEITVEMLNEILPALRIAAVEAGIIPDQTRLEGELAATKLHLADLQIAFNALVQKSLKE